MPGFVSMDLYNRYKEDVWKLTNAKQRFEPGKVNRGLTDKEIASRLGLTVEEVIEIRCIAENDRISLEAYMDAEDTKEKRFEGGWSQAAQAKIIPRNDLRSVLKGH
jgi:DNA-directed RNA polymerase sigma subunit (sigma70/sigma32)